MIRVGLCCFPLPAASLRAWSAAARQTYVGRPGFSASSPASSCLHFRSGCFCVVCSALLLEAACFCQEKEFQPGARLRAGHLCFCESHVGQICVPLLCPFSDLLKATSAPTEQTRCHCSSARTASHMVPVWWCCVLCFGHSGSFSSAGYQSGCLLGEPWALLTALGCFKLVLTEVKSCHVSSTFRVVHIVLSALLW